MTTVQESPLPRGQPHAPSPLDEHRLAGRLEQLATEIRSGAAQGVSSAWPPLAVDVEAYLLAQARELPTIAPLIERRRFTQRRVEHHAAARALVDEISRQLQCQAPRASTFDLLAELLRDHATHGA